MVRTPWFGHIEILVNHRSGRSRSSQKSPFFWLKKPIEKIFVASHVAKLRYVNQTITGGLEPWIFMTFHILGIVIPTDELIFFRGVETTNQIKKGLLPPYGGEWGLCLSDKE